MARARGNSWSPDLQVWSSVHNLPTIFTYNPYAGPQRSDNPNFISPVTTAATQIRRATRSSASTMAIVFQKVF
jgi:hypothetical protein